MSFIKSLILEHGCGKAIGRPSENPKVPHYSLLRNFLGLLDYLIIFNTPRCRYRCRFCDLPKKNTKHINFQVGDIYAQFCYAMAYLAPAVDVVQRFTVSNEGSALDFSTFPQAEWVKIFDELQGWRSLREIVLESRSEFASPDVLDFFDSGCSRLKKHLLLGFESSNERIRNTILGKQEPTAKVVSTIKELGRRGWALIAYVIYKPDPSMSHEDADNDTIETVSWLKQHADMHGVDLTVRINPLYLIHNSPLGRKVSIGTYQPPMLSRCLALAQSFRANGIRCYIGLSAEGFDGLSTTFRDCSDYSPQLLKTAIIFNLGQN